MSDRRFWGFLMVKFLKVLLREQLCCALTLGRQILSLPPSRRPFHPSKESYNDIEPEIQGAEYRVGTSRLIDLRLGGSLSRGSSA